MALERAAIVTVLAAIAASGPWGCDQDGAPSAPEPAPRVTGAAVTTTWPALPRTAHEAEGLVRRRTRRPADAAVAVDADRLEASIRQAVQQGRAVMGWPEIERWARGRIDTADDHDRWVIFGTTHDAEAQVTAFRRLFSGRAENGPAAIVATELFRADGRWDNVPRAAQRGDDSALRDYLTTGSSETWEVLRARQEDEDYTAWKYEYLPAVMDQLLEARATGRTLRGCDMPQATQSLLSGVSDALRLRLRELHCVLSIDDAVARPRGMAVMVGDAHAWAEGVRRFLPPEVSVVAIHAFGGRVSDHAPERALGERLRLTDPVLVPLSGSDHALVLPDPHLGARRERRRDRLEAPLDTDDRHVVTARAEPPCMLRLDAAEPVALDDEDTRLPAGPGSHPFLCERDGPDLLGVLRMPDSGALELVVRADEIDVLVRVPPGPAR